MVKVTLNPKTAREIYEKAMEQALDKLRKGDALTELESLGWLWIEQNSERFYEDYPQEESEEE